VICDGCVKDILKKMNPSTFTFQCPKTGCFRQDRPESRYISKCFIEDALTLEKMKVSKEGRKAQSPERPVDLEETQKNTLQLDSTETPKEPQGHVSIPKLDLVLKEPIPPQAEELSQTVPEIVGLPMPTDQPTTIPQERKDSGESKKEKDTFDLTHNQPTNVKTEDEERALSNTKPSEPINLAPVPSEILADGQTVHTPQETVRNSTLKVLNDWKPVDLPIEELPQYSPPCVLTNEESGSLGKNMLNTGEEVNLNRRMTTDNLNMSRRTSALTGRLISDSLPLHRSQSRSNRTDLESSFESAGLQQRHDELSSLAGEDVFSASVIQACDKRITRSILESRESFRKSEINHFPKTFERHEVNLRTITIEQWLFSRKIVPHFYSNCVQFSRSSTSKGTSLHTVMTTTPIDKETLIKVTLLKYDATESSHFGFCDKSESLSLQENKMRFNPEAPHCYITDGYSKFKVSDNEFSALSWKSSIGSTFRSGDEIYIHVAPQRSIVFYLKRQNISVRYKGFHKFCDIRFFMTIVMRGNVFQYQQLI
jgi:hypothetical protein